MLVLNKIYEYVGVSAILDAGPLFSSCVFFLAFMSSSFTLFLLSYVKRPILGFMPSFSSLRDRALSKSGCELYVLKIYVMLIYIPFVIMFGLMINQYIPFLAVFVYSSYQAVILFRRVRLLNRFLNKVYDLFSSDLGIKEYVKRDYSSFLCSMLGIKQAVENGWFFKRPSGLQYGLLGPHQFNKEALAELKLKKIKYKSRLLNSEEYLHLPAEGKADALRAMKFVFYGIEAHSGLFITTGESKRSGITVVLTGAPFDRQLNLMVGRALLNVSTDLAPLCERWAREGTGIIDKPQLVVSGFAIPQEECRYFILNPKSKSLNTKFFEEENWKKMDAAVSPFENFTKEFTKYEGKVRHQSQIIAHFNSSGDKRIVPITDSFDDIPDLLD